MHKSQIWQKNLGGPWAGFVSTKLRKCLADDGDVAQRLYLVEGIVFAYLIVTLGSDVVTLSKTSSLWVAWGLVTRLQKEAVCLKPRRSST
jgi:hypothetical protein